MTILARVDLRGGLGAARDQGQRPTCLAFALSDLNRQANRLPAPLSAEFLYREAATRTFGWRPGDGLHLQIAINAAIAPGQPFERLCPYMPLEPTLPLALNPPCSPMFAHSFSHHAPRVADIVADLDMGKPVGLVLRLTPDFFVVDANPAQVPFSWGTIEMPHAVVAVGYGDDTATQELHVLIRNSWGSSWGDAGHAWLPERYLAFHGLATIGL